MSDIKKLKTPTLLQTCGVTKVYGNNKTIALDNFSMTIKSEPPSITALVGESGSGKSTLAQLLLGLITPSLGDVTYLGKSLQRLNASEKRAFRRDVQIIFQDPFDVYNPFYKIDHLLTVPIEKFRLASSQSERKILMESVLNAVGLDPQEVLGRYPHQLSGGQRQRIAIARVLLIRPHLIIADEPVSMVDASLRASILANLQQLNQKFGISVLYITHDLTTAYQISTNIVVLYRGSVVEAGDVEMVIHSPKHPYTQLLIDSIPEPDPKHRWGSGTIPIQTMTEKESERMGCKFCMRCPHITQVCRTMQPPLFKTKEHQAVACFLYKDAPVIKAEDLDNVFISNQ
ncbi:MAG: ABC transporter ATP-binding protein [Flexilinea sp.]